MYISDELLQDKTSHPAFFLTLRVFVVPFAYLLTVAAALAVGVPWSGAIYVLLLPGLAILPLSVFCLNSPWHEVLTGGKLPCVGLATCTLCLLGELAAILWYPPASSELLGIAYAGVHVGMFGWVLASE